MATVEEVKELIVKACDWWKQQGGQFVLDFKWLGPLYFRYTKPGDQVWDKPTDNKACPLSALCLYLNIPRARFKFKKSGVQNAKLDYYVSVREHFKDLHEDWFEAFLHGYGSPKVNENNHWTFGKPPGVPRETHDRLMANAPDGYAFGVEMRKYLTE